jgi:hypothetical protein
MSWAAFAYAHTAMIHEVSSLCTCAHCHDAWAEQPLHMHTVPWCRRWGAFVHAHKLPWHVRWAAFASLHPLLWGTAPPEEEKLGQLRVAWNLWGHGFLLVGISVATVSWLLWITLLQNEMALPLKDDQLCSTHCGSFSHVSFNFPFVLHSLDIFFP